MEFHSHITDRLKNITVGEKTFFSSKQNAKESTSSDPHFPRFSSAILDIINHKEKASNPDLLLIDANIN